MKDRQSLLLYLGIVLLCAICFAVGISIGRASLSAGSAVHETGQQSAAHPVSPGH